MEETPEDTELQFDELLLDYSALPGLLKFSARDGTHLHYRQYPAESDTAVILLHGSGSHSRYFLPLAKHLSGQGEAQVFTPDLRGHGENPVRRGDIDYIEQFEDDVMDLIAYIRETHSIKNIVLGGHSSGGGLALRFAGSQYGPEAQGYVLLAPFLRHDAPTMRTNAGGWARPYIKRTIGLSILNGFGIRWLNSLDVIAFNMPQAFRDGTETLAYTYRLNTGYAPRDYTADLRAIKAPLLVVVGTADEAFDAQQFKPTVSQHAEAEVVLLDGVSHMGVVVGEAVQSTLSDWLQKM
jgi:non-heme chloroperoxidase